jgi:hypothetical protein
MDAFGIVYSQYWLQPKSKTRFAAHLVIFKDAFNWLKKLGLDELWVPRFFFG